MLHSNTCNFLTKLEYARVHDKYGEFYTRIVTKLSRIRGINLYAKFGLEYLRVCDDYFELILENAQIQDEYGEFTLEYQRSYYEYSRTCEFIIQTRFALECNRIY